MGALLRKFVGKAICQQGCIYGSHELKQLWRACSSERMAGNALAEAEATAPSQAVGGVCE